MDLQERKTVIRKQAHENRKNQPDKEEVSTRIVNRFLALPEYAQAKTVMFYVDVRDEVRTRQALPDALLSGKRIVVPYCLDGELELFHLESMDELELGMYRILEPRVDLRTVKEKHLQPEDLDLVMVPGWLSIVKGDEPDTAKAITINCCNMPEKMHRSSRLVSNANFSMKFQPASTTFLWIRWSRKITSL